MFVKFEPMSAFRRCVQALTAQAGERVQVAFARVAEALKDQVQHLKPRSNQPIIMRILKKDLKPWIVKAELVHLQNRARFHQSVFKNHKKFKNPGSTSVWRRRSYITSTSSPIA